MPQAGSGLVSRCSDPIFCQLICCFVSSNALMPWHPYQLYPVMSGQLHDWWQSQTSFEMVDICQVPLLQLDSLTESVPIIPI
jgi:hypothetical protein